MSWDGYLKWLETQKIKLQDLLNENGIWEAKDVAETTLFTLKQDGILKVLKGYTDIHQVWAVAGKS